MNPNKTMHLPSGAIAVREDVTNGRWYAVHTGHGQHALLNVHDVEALYADSIADDGGRDLAIAACQGKRRYRTENAAGQAAESARTRDASLNLRIYSCPICGGFHLTKHSLAHFAGVGR